MTKWWVGIVWLCAFLCLLFNAACAGTARSPVSDPKHCLVKDNSSVICTKVEGTDDGLSDLAIDKQGSLWTVSESSHKAYRFSSASEISKCPQVIDVSDADRLFQGLDLEGIAVLNEDTKQFALSTEQSNGAHSKIFLATLTKKHLEIDERRTIEITPQNTGLLIGDNDGAEGICGQGEILFVSIETVQRQGKKRWAPLLLFNLAERKKQLYKIPLSTSGGKISALHCRIANGKAEILAIERAAKSETAPKDVRRFHSFTIKIDNRPKSDIDESFSKEELENLPEISDPQWTCRDLIKIINEHCKDMCKPNPEGIVKLSDGTLLIVSDNKNGKKIKSTNQIWTFRFNHSISNCTP